MKEKYSELIKECFSIKIMMKQYLRIDTYIVSGSVFFVLFLMFLPGGPATGQQVNSKLSRDINMHNWIEQHFAMGKVPPFTFVYGGKSSDTFICNWQYSAEKLKSNDSHVEEFVYKYQDDLSGIAVRCFVTCFKDFNAVEWVLKFSNTSGKNTPLIEKAAVIDHSFVSEEKGTFFLYHARGSNGERTDYQPIDEELKLGGSTYMTPAGGRSSDNTAFPFFNIGMPGSQGIMVAIGWTGKWFADVRQLDEKSVSLKSGMENMQVQLYPKEEIRTPRICLLFWSGKDRMKGHNQFRQFILAHHTRKTGGRFTDVPLSASLSPSGPPPCNGFYGCLTDSFALAVIDRLKRLDIVPDVFWMDAGWYEGGKEWWEGVGNWTVDKKRFPMGLKPISDAVHKAGSKFLLWFEPERVRKGSRFEKEHPEWLLEYPGTRNSEDIYNHDSYLFDLGNREARLWLTDFISDFLRKEGVDYYRQDMNWVDLQGCWKMKDKPGRIGISEIRHIEGLYAFWDSLLVRFPELLIDNCASGGRRIDLETISRSSPLWQSDYLLDEPEGYQNHAYGLNFYLPLHGTGTKYVIPYDFRSALSSTLLLFWDVCHDSLSVQEMHKRVAEFKKLRPYYYRDYYPLTEAAQLLKDNDWLAYQLNRPDKGDGIIMAFRRKNCNAASLTVKLRGVDAKESYVVTDEDTDMEITASGEELINGFKLTVNDKPGSLLIWYKKSQGSF